jgi:hypothetical protein
VPVICRESKGNNTETKTYEMATKVALCGVTLELLVARFKCVGGSTIWGCPGPPESRVAR